MCISDYSRVLDWIIGLTDTLYTQNSGLQAITALPILHTLQFTFTHTLAILSLH
jgi:hypothetical protein